ncbi:hypothetical protein MMC20_007086 [Loxospora ochrophaea]|nr:hypothetical protein [Loxospora ochrophaea]
MPVSHIGLTVSHLPTSCSFFLAALAPLGYRYIGQQDNQIAFGIDLADFYICQETPGYPAYPHLPTGISLTARRNKAGPAHIAFSAPTRSAVDHFFTAALKSGGRIHGEPAVRDQESKYYSAAVLDFDGNSIEAVYREDKENMPSHAAYPSDGTRVVTLHKEIPRSVTASPTQSHITRNATRTIVNNMAAPNVIVTRQSPSEVKYNEDMQAKSFIGILLGAAGGAAIAYAMTKGEGENVVPVTYPTTQTHVYQAIEAPRSPRPSTNPEPSYASPNVRSHAPSTTSHRRRRSSASSARPRAIEAAPVRTARSTLIDTFVPPSEVARYASGPPPSPSHHSTHASSPRTRPPSSHHSSQHTVTQADHHSKAPSRQSHSYTPLHRPSSKAGSQVSAAALAKHDAILSAQDPPRSVVSRVKEMSLPASVLDKGSVAPSDSVSQAGSSKRERGSRSGRSEVEWRERGSVSRRSVVSYR